MLTLMTYNIRNMNDDRTENCWDKRKKALVGLIGSHCPDVLCVQEAFYPQIRYILSELPAYGYCGVGRDDGDKAGEYSAVFYKRAKFSPVSTGTFWLSQTPDIPSCGFDGAHNRICTWAELSRKGELLAVCSLHLDHKGEVAKREGAKIVRERALQFPEQCIVAGDFNSVPDSEPISIMSQPPFSDARLAAPERHSHGTFRGFEPNVRDWRLDPPIDHVFFTPGKFSPRRAEIITTTYDDRYPSDHFPLLVTFNEK